MRTIKQTRKELRAWGRVMAAARSGEGWHNINHIERLKDAAQVGFSTSHQFKHQSASMYFPEWVEQITKAIEAIEHPAVRRMVVVFYVQMDCPRSALPRHCAKWLADGECLVMRGIPPSSL